MGGGSPHHHIYEWGTTSLFATMGILRQVHKSVDGTKTHTDTMEVGFTKSIKLLQDLLNDPNLLMVKPILPPPPLTKREYRQKLESARKGSKKSS